MNLAIVSGRRPAVLTDIDRLKPLVRDHDVVAFGFRDAEQSRQYGSRASEYLRYTPASLTKYVSWELPLPPNKRSESCSGTTLKGFWIHVDAAVGMNVGIFNPAMDADGSIARGLVS